jgi:hypothetical protein
VELNINKVKRFGEQEHTPMFWPSSVIGATCRQRNTTSRAVSIRGLLDRYFSNVQRLWWSPYDLPHIAQTRSSSKTVCVLTDDWASYIRTAENLLIIEAAANNPMIAFALRSTSQLPSIYQVEAQESAGIKLSHLCIIQPRGKFISESTVTPCLRTHTGR